MSRYATTDLHGCLHTFRYLVEEELRLTRDDELYLLGDYVNKGPDSRGVLDYLMQLQASGYRVQCLRGNHDQALLDGARHRWRWDWLGPRGRLPTLRSFGVARLAYIPDHYLDWVAALPYEIELPDVVLVHAGYNFALPAANALARQRRIAVNQDGQNLVVVAFVLVLDFGAHEALHHRVHGLKVRGIGGQLEVDF